MARRTRMKYTLSTCTDNRAEGGGPIEGVALLNAWARYEASSVAERLAEGSLQAKYRSWRHFLAWLQGAHTEVQDLQDVTHVMAEEYLAFFQCGHAAITCTLRVCFLREMFRVILTSCGYEAENPWDGIRPKSGPVCTRRELTLDEVRRLLVAADGFGREWRMLFSLAIYTGMRLGDCCCIGWEAIDLASSKIQIVPHKTRRYFAGRSVVIPLHSELAALLAETSPDKRVGHVMASIAHDFGSRRWNVSRTLNRIFVNAGIPSSILLEGRERRTPLATFHSLRHTFVSIAVNAGVPIPTVQSIVGHASAAMTQHYYHPSEEALRQAVSAIPAIGSCATTSQSVTRHVPTPKSVGLAFHRQPQIKPTLCSRLKELGKARKRGLVTEEEFATLRQTILADA